MIHPRDYQMTQNLIMYAVETNIVIDLIKEKLSAVDQHVIDIAENTLRLLDFFSLAVIEIKFLLVTECKKQADAESIIKSLKESIAALKKA